MITMFALKYTFTLNTIFGIIPGLTIETILIEKTVKTQVTIFYLSTVIAILGVKVSMSAAYRSWHYCIQLSPLSEKCLIKIYITSVLQSTPGIRIPVFIIVNWEWYLW